MKSKKFTTTFLLIALLVAGLIVVNGCKKSEPAAVPKPTEPTKASEPVKAPEPTEAAEPTAQKESKPIPDELKALLSKIEQKECPVIKGPINKEIFTEYKGKKVYFCCQGCKEEFEKNPEKYVSKLPQFIE